MANRKPSKKQRRKPGHSWKKYERLVAKMAWSRHRTTGLPFEELMAEGRLGFAEAIRSYRKERARFSTHLTWTVRGRLTSYVTNQHKHRKQVELAESGNPDPALIDRTTPERHCRFLEAMTELSQEARMVVRLVLDSPSELIEEARRSHHRAINLGMIARRLQNMGLSGPQAKQAIAEVKLALKEL